VGINPYQPPREPDPLTKKPPLKRAIGVGTILLLTPLAVLIAGGASCAAAVAIVERFSDTAMGVGMIVCLTPPALALVAMIWWAVRASKHPKQ
jgi:hypothetical protein